MMVDLTVLVIPVSEEPLLGNIKCLTTPEGVHVGVDQNLNEGKQQIENKPDVDHLDVGSLRQIVGDIDEHGGQHEHCFKEEFS